VITEKEDLFEISSAELIVSACQSEPYAWRLELRSDAAIWTLRVGGAFSITPEAAGTRLETMDVVSNLAGHSVVTIRARKRDGELEMKFDDGRILIVEPDPDYEAWEMFSTRGERLIAVPGNGIAKWGETVQ
jgi:hypothetical protein